MQTATDAADFTTERACAMIRTVELIDADVRRAEIITAAQLLSGRRSMNIADALDYLNDTNIVL